MVSERTIAWDERGLVPVIAQDAETGQVLMLAYADREALAHTLETGLAHFWSRSRRRLWRKGETSGHTLAVCEVRVDCDADALLYRVRPQGPACHTGEATCFYRTLARLAVPGDCAFRHGPQHAAYGLSGDMPGAALEEES